MFDEGLSSKSYNGSNIKTEKDVMKEVAKEAGISEKMVEYHIKFLAHWLKTLASKANIHNIYIPFIGAMYSKWGMVKRDIEYALRDTNKYPLTQKYEESRERWESVETYGEKFRKSYNRHMKRSKITNYFFNKQMSYKELEEWQNKEE